jgi:hypothetical protein
MVDTKELRKAGNAVYLACHEDVARDLSEKLVGAAEQIEEDARKFKELKDLFESITCHRVEGVEFFSTTEILDAIYKDAMKGYHICDEATP